MRKPRSFAEVYNDLDDAVVGVFRVLRDPAAGARLLELLGLTPWSRTEFYEAYLPSDDPIERARRQIVRSYMGFGTTSRRANRTGFRARAYRQNQTGPQDWVSYRDAVPEFITRLNGVTIENRDAGEVIAQQDSLDTLIYCDPPYPWSTRTSRQWQSSNDSAYAKEMSDPEHRDLARQLRAVAGMVVISSYPSPLYDELYGDWRRVETQTIADGARPRTEVLWLNPACATALDATEPQARLFA